VITLVDYGIGNLRSIEKAFERVGVPVVRTDDPDRIARAERVALPGVGAFGACRAELDRRGLIEPVLHAAGRGVPLLGICVGMQLLFDASEEMGVTPGLGLLPGRVVRFAPGLSEYAGDGAPPRRLKVPHMGWSRVASSASPLLSGLEGDADTAPHYYFVHSYHAAPERDADVLGWARYGERFPAIVGRGNVFGVQFHPEKSQHAGLRLLMNFATLPL
jgi:glutamine amidotransferase